MDDAMIARLLSTYDGAQPTVKNVNAARQFFATNPEIAEKRAMGLRGSGIDDNSDIFGAQLEKFMQAAEAEPPAGRVEVGPIEQVAAPTQQAAPRQAPTQMSNMPAQPEASRQGGYAPPVTRESARPGGGFGLDDFLTALLGLSSVAGRNIMGGNAPAAPPAAPKQKALPRAVGEDGKLLENPYPDGQKRLTYQPKLEDNVSDLSRVKTNEPPTTQVTNDPALNEQGRRAQLQAEIDAENEKRKLEMDTEELRPNSEAKKLKDQAETKKLLDAIRKSNRAGGR